MSYGELAQLGEHLPCTQGVKGSNPLFSTMNLKVHQKAPWKLNRVSNKDKDNEIKDISFSETGKGNRSQIHKIKEFWNLVHETYRQIKDLEVRASIS